MKARTGKSFFLSLALLVFATLSLSAASMHPVERRLRDGFPSVAAQTSSLTGLRLSAARWV